MCRRSVSRSTLPTPDTTDTLADAHAYCLQLRSHGPLEALHCELCQVGGVEFCEYVRGPIEL
jgi:hypothetical protein